MTNTANTSKSIVNTLDCVEFLLDSGFVPLNTDAVRMSSNGLYKHSELPVTCRVEDIEAGDFDLRVYEVIELGGRKHFGPEIYRVRLNNVPFARFSRAVLGLLVDLPSV
jgi:hypothetical protein